MTPKDGPRGNAKRPPRPMPKRQDRLARYRYQRPPRFKRYLQVRP